MKFKNLFLFAAIAILASCGKYEFDATQVNQELSLQRAKNQLGVDIDPNQNWRPIRHGSVTIIANADLENIVRVELLTESPFGNEEAAILSKKDCKPGEQVTLTYEAPDYLTELVAACINDKGVYYIKAFDIDDQMVDFKSANARRRATSLDGYPTSITLGSCIKSFNALRAEASKESDDNNVYSYENPKNTNSTSRGYTAWSDGSWINDRLWTHAGVVGNGWTPENGTICRNVTSEGDLKTVETILAGYLPKYDTNKKKNNNWKSIAAGNEYFTLQNNYVVSDGTPVVLIPLQMNTSEGGYNSIYYYYFNPAEAPIGDLRNYIKSLPKFKAITGYKGDTDPKLKREREYLLPYYGNNPIEGMQASAVIPKGYYIGFLNRKDYDNKGDIHNCASGCTYGDGALNNEVNHLVGHYFSALDNQIFQYFGKDKKYGSTSNGMDWDSPRIGVFSANNHSYLCFEDGADCNFCDMIVEIKQGTDIIQETMVSEVRMNAYTMCFEDRPLEADYDMNDLVLTAEKTDPTHIKLTILACGAQDDLTLHGIKGSTVFEGKEIHDLLGIEKGTFFNTQVGGNTGPGVSEIIETGNMTIEDFLINIYIVNEVKHQPIKMPSTGEAPYAIIVPRGFNYPMEGTSINKAYPYFLEWAQNMNTNKDWYNSIEGVNRFPLYFIQ